MLLRKSLVDCRRCRYLTTMVTSTSPKIEKQLDLLIYRQLNEFY